MGRCSQIHEPSGGATTTVRSLTKEGDRKLRTVKSLIPKTINRNSKPSPQDGPYGRNDLVESKRSLNPFRKTQTRKVPGSQKAEPLQLGRFGFAPKHHDGLEHIAWFGHIWRGKGLKDLDKNAHSYSHAPFLAYQQLPQLAKPGNKPSAPQHGLLLGLAKSLDAGPTSQNRARGERSASSRRPVNVV